MSKHSSLHLEKPTFGEPNQPTRIITVVIHSQLPLAVYMDYQVFLNQSKKSKKYTNLAPKSDTNSVIYHIINAQILNRRPNPPLTDAAREAQLCIKLEPNNADAHFDLGFVFVYGGKPDSAIKYHQAALRFDPANKAEIENEIAVAYFGKEDFDTAAKHAEIAIPASPTNSEYSLIAAAAYARLDQMDKAKAAIEEVNRKRKGDFGRKFDEYWRNLWLTFKYFKKDEDRERIQNALLKAGILE